MFDRFSLRESVGIRALRQIIFKRLKKETILYSRERFARTCELRANVKGDPNGLATFQFDHISASPIQSEPFHRCE
jgi:hypothetical protein